MSKKVYVKDSEGFVTQKLDIELQADEVIISKKEYEDISGIKYYKEQISHGGARKGAGRRSEFEHKVRITIDIEEKELEFIRKYADKHNISRNKAFRLALNKLQKA